MTRTNRPEISGHQSQFHLADAGIRPLANFFDFCHDLVVRELHETLLRPWQDGKDRIFADEALPLFTAAAKYGESVGEHPLAVLARRTQDSLVNALQQASAIAPVP